MDPGLTTSPNQSPDLVDIVAEKSIVCQWSE